MDYRIAGLVGVATLLGACIITSGSEIDDDGETGAGNNTSQGGGGGIDFGSGGGGTGGITDPPCDNDPGIDGDGDGWTGADGDCNDCTELMNPGAFDYAGNNIDEDCDGGADNTVEVCDGALALDSNDPLDGARAMDLCTMQAGESWGVVSAQYINADGSPATGGANYDLGHGILSHFGDLVNPQGGQQMFSVSSGTARNPTDPGYQSVGGFDKGYTSGAAPGFPKESAACPGVVTGTAHDSIALRVQIKSPTNAKSLAFNVNMYTYEFPVFICSTYNDFVTAIMAPAPTGLADATCGGIPCGNISFDSQGNPLSVNAGFLEVCDAQMAGGKNFPCNLGNEQLGGTDFEGHAATGWLQTAAPLANPGEDIILEFGAWDSGDGVLDTTGLFDNFTWGLEETPTQTEPVPSPK
jgi:hypothetical protein